MLGVAWRQSCAVSSAIGGGSESVAAAAHHQAASEGGSSHKLSGLAAKGSAQSA